MARCTDVVKMNAAKIAAETLPIRDHLEDRYLLFAGISEHYFDDGK